MIEIIIIAASILIIVLAIIFTAVFISSGAETQAETPGTETPGTETPGAETPGAETPAETPDLDFTFSQIVGDENVKNLNLNFDTPLKNTNIKLNRNQRVALSKIKYFEVPEIVLYLNVINFENDSVIIKTSSTGNIKKINVNDIPFDELYQGWGSWFQYGIKIFKNTIPENFNIKNVTKFNIDGVDFPISSSNNIIVDEDGNVFFKNDLELKNVISKIKSYYTIDIIKIKVDKDVKYENERTAIISYNKLSDKNIYIFFNESIKELQARYSYEELKKDGKIKKTISTKIDYSRKGVTTPEGPIINDTTPRKYFSSGRISVDSKYLDIIYGLIKIDDLIILSNKVDEKQRRRISDNKTEEERLGNSLYTCTFTYVNK